MHLTNGTKLGPYEIITPLGAGGMGEVYRARDTRLGRDVAIKVLPPHLTSNPDVRARFEREAKTVSSLNHPNICTLFDVGREGETDYLVMELIEGETLAARVARGALPPGETLRIGVQIADALDRAHRAGVVHRDLKPGNVMLTKSGAKLMDFGLARAVGMGGTGGLSTGVTVAGLTQSPTMGQPLTAEGTIVGTFQYMAPEQLEGREADARSDVWSLGCVLYEMTTGKRAFDGKSQASLIGSIMTTSPAPVSQVAPMTPPALDRLVVAMLEKDPAERIQSAHDVKLQLQWASEGASTAGSPAVLSVRKTRTSWIPWTVAGIALAVAAVLGWRGLHDRPSDDGRSVHAAIMPPPGVLFSSSTDRPLPIALSHDGELIAFCARSGEGTDMLWVRSLDADDARSIPGTEGAEGPFFSPDDKSIGFFAVGALKRVDTGGGAVITLAEGIDPRGGTWNANGTILFGNGTRNPLGKIREDGGKIEFATALDSTRTESTHRYPCFLPDGKHFVYLARQSGAGAGRQPAIFVGELGSTKRTLVMEVASNVIYASGHLLYVREGVLVAQRFNLKTFALSGSAVPIVDEARMDERFSRGVFSVSDNGVLVCMTGSNQTRTQLQWLDRKGALIANIGEPAEYTYGGVPELSSDDAFSVMPISNRERGTSDVWVVDLATGRRRRLSVDQDDHPAAIWAGRGVITVSTNGTRRGYSVDLLAADGVRERLLIFIKDYVWPRSVSPDGRVLLFHDDLGGPERSDVKMVALTGDTTATIIAGGEGSQGLPQFSPDGRFFSYQSDESGRLEVYVAVFPSGARWQVSQDGGTQPRWRGDGKELYYIDGDNYVVAVQVFLGAGSFEAGTSTKLFQFHGTRGGWRYDNSRDGSRFLVTRPLSQDLAMPVTVITDWTRKVTSK